MIFLKLFAESFVFAFSALRENKLRTFLSLLGITIGIMTIIGVFSAVDTLRNNLQSSVDKLGSNTIYIQKWPWQFGGDYPWWKYMNRPEPKIRDFEKLQDRVEGADGVAFEIGIGDRLIKYKSNSVEGAQLAAASNDYYKTRIFNFQDGRYFTDGESRAGSPVTIIGSSIADGLFPNENGIGKIINVLGRKVTVVGIFEREGEDMLGVSNDKTILLPLNFAKNVIDVEDERYGPQITVKGKDGVTVTELESELRGLMRSIHRISPSKEDDFALNKSTILTAGLDQMFTVVNFAGLFIGGFSVLVGGFGIANIMFVSVKERTNLIGIQKSLGAKNYFILLQFLFESVLLCIIGGLIGLGIVYLLAFITKAAADLNIVVDSGKVIMMFAISTTIGIISGIIPAFMASRLDPVEAIRSK
ncbi:FtsX-like permease family protein [Pedobacter sp. HMF7647]|uniref:FtsX-like permease family protein n=1 Tax=Hufsiella arboris TaxID=2695275 RepID=A0A7K1YC96_9SPHI|nr:ABC transporter permease [Hufsiella arboris]MXV52207.1 FtsX-like permease family protein [Hufsiella arboris]